MKLYVISADTYNDSWGSQISMFGVFDEEHVYDALEELYMHLLCMHSIYYPDMRVCQFLDNFFSFLRNKGLDPFFVEDDEKLKIYINEFVGRSK